MNYSNFTKLISLLVLFLIALMFACTERGVDSNQYPIKIQMDPGFGTGELAELVNLVCLTVSARDMEPVTVCQAYTSGPLTFEINVPAGRDRLFVLQGISQTLDGQVVLYQGSAVADVEADVSVELSIHVEPIVPLIRFIPFQTVVNSGGSFQVNVEAFNLPALNTTELRFLYDPTLLIVDSITKGATLGLTDYIEVQVGSNQPGLQVMIGDTDELGTIVDTAGYSHLATLWFTSQVTVDSVETALETVFLSFGPNDGSTILPEDVYSQLAAVIIRAYALPVMRLTPSQMDIVSGQEFYLDVELFNFTGLDSTLFLLSTDPLYVEVDSFTKGLSLDESDEFEVMQVGGDFPTLVPRVGDITGGTIVDSDGYCHIARAYLTTLVTSSAASTSVTGAAGYFYLVGPDSILVDDVIYQNSIVNISAFQDRVVTFDDPALEQAVRTAIGNSVDPILLSQVWPVTYLTAGDLGVQSLAGIEEMVNLEYLELSYNQITDISPLTELPSLLTLRLDGNNLGSEPSITDFSPLADMSNLRYLSLQETYISDIAPVAGLRNLEELNLRHNGITTLPADMSQLTSLEYLDFSNLIDWPGGNNITNISALASLTGLTTLNLSSNFSLSDISPLSSLTNLNYLFLEYASISELGPLTGMLSLSILDLDYNSITDVQALVNNSGLASGDYLEIRNNPLSETACYSSVSGLPALSTRGVTVLHSCPM